MANRFVDATLRLVDKFSSPKQPQKCKRREDRSRKRQIASSELEKT